MAMTQNFPTHRRWEDLCSMGFGAVILFSPVIAQTVDWPYVTLNAVLVGLVVMVLAWQELVLLERWEEYAEAAVGLWLAASPWMFGYSDYGVAGVMHLALGFAVTVLALVEFYQDSWTARPAA